MCTHAHMRVAGMNTFPRTPTASLHASAGGQDAVTLLLPVLTRLSSPNPTSRPGPLNTRASGHTDGQPLPEPLSPRPDRQNPRCPGRSESQKHNQNRRVKISPKYSTGHSCLDPPHFVACVKLKFNWASCFVGSFLCFRSALYPRMTGPASAPPSARPSATCLGPWEKPRHGASQLTSPGLGFLIHSVGIIVAPRHCY